MNPTYRTMLCLAATAGLAIAQGPRGGGMNPAGGQGATYNSTLVMAKLQTVTGTAVSIKYGMQYPSITVNKAQIEVAPIWYLLDKNFEIQVGDSLTISAAPSSATTDPYLYAVEMTNTGTKAHIVLRDANGVPLWSQRGGPAIGSGSGPMADCPCEVLSIATESRVIENVSTGPGIQMPWLTLKLTAGTLLVIKLGSERLLLEADLELKAGDTITVKYAVTSHDCEMVALAVTKGSVSIVLRGDDGRPIWN